MKKIYEDPSMTVTAFSQQDIVTTSGFGQKTKTLLEDDSNNITLDGKSGDSFGGRLFSIDF